jgi:hypothetical protein
MDSGKLDKRRRDLYAIPLSIIAYTPWDGCMGTPILFGAMTVGRPFSFGDKRSIRWRVL